MTISTSPSRKPAGGLGRDALTIAGPLLNPATMAIAGVALAALAALAILLFTEPSQAGKSSRDDDGQVQLVALAMPHGARDKEADLRALSSPATRTLKVRSGDTLMKVLTKAGAEPADGHAAITALRTVYNPRRLQVGQEVTVIFAKPQAGDAVQLAALRIAPDVDREVAVERNGAGGFAAREIMRELEQRAVRSAGTIDQSLFVAAEAAGLPANVIVDLIRIFSFDVDFEREIQPGDRFEVFYDRFFDKSGTAIKDGDILYASLTLSGQKLAYYRYTPKDDGFADYFDAKGQSVKKGLMRTPIDGARLTSGYGKRLHPVLGYNRMHRGVDFGARTGTPIMAAGNGTIVQVGWNGAYGKYVKIRHSDTYATAYAHMSRFTNGLRPGSRVRQGEIIGYVGTTGRSTGPHLHYEVLVKNNQVNPLGVKLPTGRKLKGKEYNRFESQVAKLQTMIAASPIEERHAAAE